MRLTDLRREETAGGAAVRATVHWEQTRRSSMPLEYRTTHAFARDLEPRPEAFVTAALWPAWEAGETRIAVEGTCCPRLRDGLLTAQHVLAHWYGIAAPFVRIDPTDGWQAPEPASPGRAAMFLSGGLDSLALMRQLCDAFPPGHPARVRDAFFAYGIDVGLPGERPRHDFYQRAREGLEVLCRSEGMELVPVWTNLRGLLRRGSDWPRAYFGLGTVSIAHAFSARVSDVAIAASVDVFGLAPNGSHPMLDPYFSSSALAIRHDGLHQNRLEKAAVVAAWPEALPLLRVCYNDTGPGGPLNCGRCRKCVRTMLALLALGRLGDATSFPVREVTPAMVEACTVDPLMVSFYEAVLEPLEQAGREDLARELRRRLSAFARRERWSGFRRLLLPWR